MNEQNINSENVAFFAVEYPVYMNYYQAGNDSIACAPKL
jgi:hypothetical protein